MKLKTTLAAALLAVTAAGSAFADAIPYPCCGLNGTAYSFYAIGSQDLVAYFYGSDAGLTETLGVLVNGVDRGLAGTHTNHSQSQGDSYDFGHVNAGDTLTFYISINGSSPVISYYSDPSMNADGLNHVYATPYSGAIASVPAGLYVSFEDLPNAGDRDYNDTSFVFTGVTTVPEPENLALLLGGLGLLGFMARRRRG